MDAAALTIAALAQKLGWHAFCRQASEAVLASQYHEAPPPAPCCTSSTAHIRTCQAYGFNQPEARQSFRLAMAADPTAPAPYWGMAYALGTSAAPVPPTAVLTMCGFGGLPSCWSRVPEGCRSHTWEPRVLCAIGLQLAIQRPTAHVPKSCSSHVFRATGCMPKIEGPLLTYLSAAARISVGPRVVCQRLKGRNSRAKGLQLARLKGHRLYAKFEGP